MDETVLPVTPWLLATVATTLIVALGVPPGGPRAATWRAGPSPVAGPVGAALLAVAAVLVVLVGRAGPDSELRNPVPALVVGLGWPLLLLLPALVGLLHRPVDALDGPRGDARPAVVLALAVVGYLVVPAAPTRPDAVATAVAAYAVLVLATAVAVGRRTAGEQADVLGLLVRWTAGVRALPRWAAPRGALAVGAVLLGGAWAERYERTTTWSTGLPTRVDTVLLLAAGLALAAAGAALLARAVRAGSPGTAAAVLLPLAAGTAVAGVARRALVSGQLLLDQLAGPRAVDPDPLGLAGGQLLALGLVLVGASTAAAVLARRMGEETARLPGVGVLLGLTGVSAWVVLQP